MPACVVHQLSRIANCGVCQYAQTTSVCNTIFCSVLNWEREIGKKVIQQSNTAKSLQRKGNRTLAVCRLFPTVQQRGKTTDGLNINLLCQEGLAVPNISTKTRSILDPLLNFSYQTLPIKMKAINLFYSATRT